jgi:peptide/nickel transport system permease protein
MSATALPETIDSPESLPQWRLFWLRLKRRRIAMVGAVVLVILYLGALLAGFIAPYHFDRVDNQNFFHPPVWPHFSGLHLAVTRYESMPGSFVYRAVPGDTAPVRWFVHGDKYDLFCLIPTHIHLFGPADNNHPIYLLGTDQFGRDVFSRLLYGSQVSLSIGLVGIIISFALGLLIGGISGYFGGWTDTLIMRWCELIMSIPTLYLIIALRSVFRPNISSVQIYGMIIIIYSFIRWAGTARIIRGMTLSLRERQYVLAAKSMGQSNLNIILRHILPGTFSYVIIAATLSVPYYILGEVTISYLGVGIQEPSASWGLMLSAAQNTEYMRSFPWLLAPGAAIFITVLAFNFLGDGLRDAADTKS